MTYNAKNTTIVFAFAALLMVMPLAGSNAFADEIDANMDNTCGFSTTNLASLDFGTFDPSDSESGDALEQEVELTPVVDTSASARVLVTVADWFGVGTRSSGTLTFTDIGAGLNVDVGGNTYASISGATAGLNFQSDGNAVADAQELAAAIRAQDPLVNVSTSGTNVVTIENIIRGTAGDATVLTGAVGITASGAGTLTGASNTPQLIMDGETTKFDMNVGSSATDTYANKVGVVTLGSSQEVLGGTDPDLNIFFALEIDPVTATFSTANLPYDGPLTQEITVLVETACDGTAP